MKICSKIMSILLIMCTVFNLISPLFVVSAEKTEYTGIYSVDDLKKITEDINDDKPNGNYVLMCNLSLSSENWEPIGTSSKPFNGTFDGNGFTISNLNIDVTADETYYGGLFGYTNAIITNLRLTSVKIKVESSGSSQVGAIAGRCRSISDCYVSGKITVNEESTSGCSVGGFAGIMISGKEVKNCHNNVTIKVDSDSSCAVGSMFGQVSSTIPISNCLSNGVVDIKAKSGGRAGGFIGYCNGVNMTKCVNNVNVSFITTTGGVRAGGFIGASSDLGDHTKIYNSANLGVVSVECKKSCDDIFVGGIIGQSSHYIGDTIIKECYNMRTLSVEGYGSTYAYIGGIAADVYSQGYHEIVAENCFNAGTLVVKNAHYAMVSAIFTEMESNWTVSVKNCYSAGKYIIENCEFGYGRYISDRRGLEENNYYLKGICESGLGDGIGLSKEEFTQKSSFTGFDFENIWTFNKSGTYPYPVLRNTYSKNITITDWETDLKNKNKSNPPIDAYGIIESFDSMPKKVLVSVCARDEDSGAIEPVKDAEVELHFGDTLVMTKTTDAEGVAVFTKKELVDSGWEVGNLYNYGKLTASKKLKSDFYIVTDYFSNVSFNSFDDSLDDYYLFLEQAQLRPTLSVAFNNKNHDRNDLLLEDIIQKFYTLTDGRVKIKFSSIIECKSDKKVENSGANILIYENCKAGSRATVNGYSKKTGHVYTGFKDGTGHTYDTLIVCHELMHYLIGVFDEYCCASIYGGCNYDIDFNVNNKIDSDEYYIYWVENDEYKIKGSKDFSSLAYDLYLPAFFKKKEKDNKMSIKDFYGINLGEFPNINGKLYYISNYDGHKINLIDDNSDKVYRFHFGTISEIMLTYWDLLYIRPNGSFGIMDGNEEMTLRMSNELDYDYIDNIHESEICIHSYTAQYYWNNFKSVSDHLKDFLTEETPSNCEYGISYAQSDVDLSNYLLPVEIDAEIEVVKDSMVSDENTLLLSDASQSNTPLCSISFDILDNVTNINLSSNDLSDLVVLLQHDDSDVLERYDVSFTDGVSQIQIPKEKNAIDSIYVLSENEDGSYSYNEYIYETFSEELSDGTHISSIMTVSTENDNTDTLSIFSEENTYTNGEYFSVGKAFNVVDNSADGTEITDNFIQTISYSDDYNLDSVTAFLYDGEIYTELETTVGSGEDNCAYISFPYSGEGKYILMAKAPAETVYEAPTNLLIDDEGSTYEKEIHVSFEDSNNPLDIVAYKLYYSTSEITDTSAEGVMVETLKPGDGSYTLYLNDEYGNYYFYVEALGKDGGKSPLSEATHFSLSPYDSDADGIPDYWLKWYPDLSELEDVAESDPDEDGLTNINEYLNGTNPLTPDTDGDNVYDCVELWYNLNPNEPMTDGITDDYTIIYGTPDVSIDASSFVVIDDDVTCTIENKTESTAMRTTISLYVGDDLVDAGIVNLDANSSVEYSFSKEYLVDGMRIVIDEDRVTRDIDYTNNEFIYVPSAGVTAKNAELTVAKNTETQLEYTLSPENASDILIWTSSDESMLSVSPKGVVYAKAIGTVNVTATTLNGYHCTYNIVIEPFSGAGKTDFDCRFINDGTELEIIGYYGNDKNVAVPESIGGYPVTSIADNAFDGCDFESISIGATVNNISVSAFNGATNLESIIVNDDNTFYDSVDGVLYSFDKSILIKYPVASGNTVFVIPETITMIGENAFNGADSLQTVDVPESVTEIKSNSFADMLLSNINYAGSKRAWDEINIASDSGLSDISVSYGKFTAKFICDGETISEADYKPGEIIVLPLDTEKKYYDFIDWTPAVPETMPEYDMDFTAVYELTVETRTVEFYADGVLHWLDYRYEGETVNTPEIVPTKEGYTFIEWSPDVAEIMPNENLRYDALWEINSHKVSFVVDGEVYHSYDCVYMDTLSIPQTAPEKEGYIFANWSPAIPESMPDEDLIFTAIFDPITYTATFMHGDEIIGTDEFIVSDTSLDYPETEIKEYYDFVWEEHSIIADNITVYGGYVPTVYTATFVADGKTVDEVEFTVENPNVKVPPVPEKAGFIGKWEKYEVNFADFTVEAEYEAIVYTATFTYNGEVIGTDEFTVLNSSLDYPNVGTRTHYNWVWNEHAIVPDNITVSGEYVPIIYTIKFVSRGKVVKTQTYTIETTGSITPPSLSLPDKVGYNRTWEDWTVKTGDITVNEIYIPIWYSARYWIDGKQVGTSMFTVEYKKENLKMPTLKREGYNTVWQDFSIKPADIDIYGEYVPIEYTATFIADGTTISTQKFTVETDKLNEPAVPQKAGFIAAWSEYAIKAENITVYAKYYSPEAVTKVKVTLKTDESIRLLPSCNFEATRKTWSSSNTSVATVDKHGNITAVGGGKCKVTVTCYGKDSLGNDIKAESNTEIVVNEQFNAETLKEQFREAFNEFFQVKLHDIMYNFKEFMIILFRYAY